MAKKPQTPPRNFEEALAELEQILADIENGQVGLEESLLKYERGNFLIQHCRGVLNAAERQVEILGRQGEPPASEANGRPELSESDEPADGSEQPV